MFGASIVFIEGLGLPPATSPPLVTLGGYGETFSGRVWCVKSSVGGRTLVAGVGGLWSLLLGASGTPSVHIATSASVHVVASGLGWAHVFRVGCTWLHIFATSPSPLSSSPAQHSFSHHLSLPNNHSSPNNKQQKSHGEAEATEAAWSQKQQAVLLLSPVFRQASWPLLHKTLLWFQEQRLLSSLGVLASTLEKVFLGAATQQGALLGMTMTLEGQAKVSSNAAETSKKHAVFPKRRNT